MTARALVLALALLLAGCSSPATSGELPTEPPFLRGTVTRVDGDRVRVEENPSESSGSAKAVVTVTRRTQILWRNGDPADSADLRPGTRVQVWVTGAVAESYPVQATAATLVIESVDLPVQHPA